MSIVDDFLKALRLQGRALRFIAEHKMRWTLFVPVILFFVFSVIGFISLGELSAYLTQQLFEVEVAFLSVVLRIIFFVLLGLWGGYVIVIVMSPFLAYVSERTELILSKKEYQINALQFCKDVVRGILLALRNSFMEIIVSIVVFFCTFVPFVGPILSVGFGSIVLFLVSAYFYGFSFMDYTNERRRYSVRQSVNFVKLRKGTACGHGFIFALSLYIPLVGPFLSAICAIVSTVAATIDLVERESVLETFTYGKSEN